MNKWVNSAVNGSIHCITMSLINSWFLFLNSRFPLLGTFSFTQQNKMFLLLGKQNLASFTWDTLMCSNKKHIFGRAKLIKDSCHEKKQLTILAHFQCFYHITNTCIRACQFHTSTLMLSNVDEPFSNWQGFTDNSHFALLWYTVNRLALMWNKVSKQWGCFSLLVWTFLFSLRVNECVTETHTCSTISKSTCSIQYLSLGMVMVA